MGSATVYQCGDYHEIVLTPMTPGEPQDGGSKILLPPREGLPSEQERKETRVNNAWIASLVDSMETYEEQVERFQRRADNIRRTTHRARQKVRRYIKKYKLYNMYTLTFAENLPMSKKAEQYGEYRTVMKKGKQTSVWFWKEGRKPQGERIENNVYINSRGRRFDLTKKEEAWALFSRFIRTQNNKGYKFAYIVTAEFQNRGVVHFHMATNENLDRMSQRWRYGFIGEPKKKPQNVEHAARYISKYISKEIAEQHDPFINGDRKDAKRMQSFRASKLLTVKRVRIDTKGMSYDKFLDQYLETLEEAGMTFGDCRIYTSEQFGSEREWVVIHLSPS